jgi:hypothetical protein
MTLLAPYDLASADPVPSTVAWLALSVVPDAPMSYADVLAAQVPGVNVSWLFGDVVAAAPGQLAWRSYTLIVSGPAAPDAYPLEWAGFALVDTSDPGAFLGFAPAQAGQSLTGPSDEWTIQGYLYALRYSPPNG